MTQRELIVIGAGRAATTIASMLVDSGIPARAVISRSKRNATRAASKIAAAQAFAFSEAAELKEFVATLAGGILLFAVADDALVDVVELVTALRDEWKEFFAVHTSGATDLEILSGLQHRGAQIAAFHPCYPIYEAASQLPRDGSVAYTFTGDPALRDVLKQITQSWGGQFFELSGVNRLRYHAAQVLVAGHLVALLGSASETLEQAGVARETAREIVRSVSAGVLFAYSEQALDDDVFQTISTGPFARGDEKTIAKQLRDLNDFSPAIAAVYEVLGERSRRFSQK